MYREAKFFRYVQQITEKLYTIRHYKSIYYEAPCCEISERNYFCHLSSVKANYLWLINNKNDTLPRKCNNRLVKLK
jgi:hypothetical protein